MSEVAEEKVVLVDEQDLVLGVMEKLRAHEQGLLHRAFSVFVLREVDGRVEVLLQRRALDKYHAGGLWTNTCCSHPRLNEEPEQAAMRRLIEELGFNCKLEYAGAFKYRAEFSNGLVEHEYDHVFYGWYNNEDIKPNPTEVCDYKWLSVTSLQAELNQNPSNYTPWIESALNIMLQAVKL